MTRRARLRVVAALAVVLALVGAPAVAWWTASASLSTTVSAGTVPAPTGTTCTTTGTTLNRSATVRWTAPTPAPARYRVTIAGGGQSTTTETTATQLVVTESLLGGLLQSILDLLLGGTVLQVGVQSVHDSGWVSAPGGAVAVRGALVAGTGLSGVSCA
ncbi:hypothetical protein JN535_20025 [Cellulosimicrobium cellulans]|uniref:hypothetical protein n=1 Tax=Cellulosimicrobium cellulans TaxID=1710 RepID=UPI0019623FA1|nr:hypothetical protein [Cellulosimicrobium cellulans]MBN0042441.1 hypothetical protein [Cellulosimicrobium cellulans]